MKGFSYLSSCFRFLLLLLTAGFFVSCDNFLEGSDLKKELESEIDYANSDKAVLTIYVTSADFGTVYPSSFTGAKGEKVTIEFTQKAGTEYVKWDYLGGTADGIVFSDEVNPAEPDSFGVYHRKVTVTINDPRYNYKVFPRCYAAEYNMPELDSETVAVYSTQDEDKWYYKKLIAADYDRWSIGDEDSFLGKCRQNYSNSLHVSMTGRDDSGIRGVCVEENRVMTSEAVAVYEAGV
ncbi:MAG: hypothetical protein J6Y93_00175, partial [Treponema sp.]|nr:hypothetical protein [Treponema sp.]